MQLPGLDLAPPTPWPCEGGAVPKRLGCGVGVELGFPPRGGGGKTSGSKSGRLPEKLSWTPVWALAAGLSLTRWHGSQLPPALWAHCRPCGSRPGARCEACRRRSQRQAPLGVRQLEPDAEAGGGRALGAPHRGWLPWHSRDRKPRRADWSPCCHRSKSLLGSGLSALNMRRRGSGQTLTGPAVPGAVRERHLPRGHHHETGPVFAFAGNT